MKNNGFELISYIVAGAISVVYGIKVWDDLSRPEMDENGTPKTPKNKGAIFRNVVYSAFGSGLVCLLVCEALMHFTSMDFNLCLLIGALCGYTGADSFKDILLRFIENKLNKDK